MDRPSPEKPPINDLFYRRVQTIEAAGLKRLLALSESDHLLRRFGQVQIIRINPDADVQMRLREVADEIWVLIDGRVEFIWQDLRKDSPSFNRMFHLECVEPTLVLVPFGVAFGQRPLGKPATLLRLSTHVDGQHDGDVAFAAQD